MSPSKSQLKPIVVAGGSNQVAAFLLPRLQHDGYLVQVISRSSRPDWIPRTPTLEWCQQDLAQANFSELQGRPLVYLAPMKLLPDTLRRLKPSRVVLMSSTSRFTKVDSASPVERGTAAVLQRGELELTQWATQHGVPATVLRPTMIYGAGLDQNLSRMAAVIKRWGVVLIAGRGQGKRQPVHADDLASAIVEVLRRPTTAGKAYQLTGGSTVTYRQMIEAVFSSLDRHPRIVSLPLHLAKRLLSVVRLLPSLRAVDPEMLTRMAQDLTFDSSAARTEIDYSPRPFEPKRQTWELLSQSDRDGLV